MVKVIFGKVHGRTIELNEEPGLAEGQAVELSIRPVADGEVQRLVDSMNTVKPIVISADFHFHSTEAFSPLTPKACG